MAYLKFLFSESASSSAHDYPSGYDISVRYFLRSRGEGFAQRTEKCNTESERKNA
jgi:hypothetical protein